MEKTYNFKFKVKIDNEMEKREDHEGRTIKRFRYTKDITELYGIPRPSIYKIINGNMDYKYGKWNGIKIVHINEPAFEKKDF